MAPLQEELSLRSRKKLRTRQQIADAAVTLFAARGYDAVTVADIARLAEVSEQTVYNFFSSKEQLVLDEDAAFEARLIKTVRERPDGKSLAESVRADVQAFLDQLTRWPQGPQNKGGMPYLIVVSPALRRAWLEAVDRYGDSVARVLVEQSGGALSRSVAKVLGLSIVAVYAVILDEIGRGVEKGTGQRAVIEALRPQVNDAIDRIASSLKSVEKE
jgi:AcrR family transcriptional regulator